MSRRKKKKIKHIEWSKILTSTIIVFFAVYGIWSGIEYYYLCKLAIANNSSTLPDATLAVTCVTTILASLVSYCLYSFGLKNSLNKNGLSVDDATGIVSPINKNDNAEVLENIVKNDVTQNTELVDDCDFENKDV